MGVIKLERYRNNRSGPTFPPNNSISLFFPPVLRHTASAVPATLLRSSYTMAIRLKDLAHYLELSVSTISAALQNRGDISEATRLRVVAAVEKFGYHPNSLARSLVTRKTNVLGVLVPDLSRSFFAEVLKGIDSVWRKILSRLSIPLVLIDRRLPGLNFVGGDDTGIGFQATQHLYDQGYRRIAHIAGPSTVTTAVGRLSGYRRALVALRLPSADDLVIESHYHEESGGYAAMRRLLKLAAPPDAVFAASDPIAISALQAALEANLDLPADFGLIGVGNHRYGRFLRVPLSTVDHQRSQIGRLAAELLLASMEKRRVRPKSILTEPKLVVRDSSNRTGVSETLIAAGGVKKNAERLGRR
jgi:LacI family transcriptional regulator